MTEYTMTLEGKEAVDKAMKKYISQIPRLRDTLLKELARNGSRDASRFATKNVGHGIGLAGHYAEQFISIENHVKDGWSAVENEARNPLYKNFPYGLAIETGHLREYNAPLILNGQPTALGLWAEEKIGYVFMGNHYLRPDGKSVTRMRVQMPAHYPMRDAYNSTKNKLNAIIKTVMEEIDRG